VCQNVESEFMLVQLLGIPGDSSADTWPMLFLRLRIVRHRPCDDWTPAMDAGPTRSIKQRNEHKKLIRITFASALIMAMSAWLFRALYA
jgi:hypothetical protein